HGYSDGFEYPRYRFTVGKPSGKHRVEVYYVQRLRARLLPFERRFRGVAILRRLLHIAHFEPYANTVFNIDSRVYLHASSPNLLSISRPTAALFSGWNCTPIILSFATA